MKATSERPEEDAGGVDLTLIDAMLALSPEERLRQNDRVLRMIQELRDGFADQPDDPAGAPGGERR